MSESFIIHYLFPSIQFSVIYGIVCLLIVIYFLKQFNDSRYQWIFKMIPIITINSKEEQLIKIKTEFYKNKIITNINYYIYYFFSCLLIWYIIWIFWILQFHIALFIINDIAKDNRFTLLVHIHIFLVDFFI